MMLKIILCLVLAGFLPACGRVPNATGSAQNADGWIAFIGGGEHENLVLQLIRPDGSRRLTVMPDADSRSDFSGPGWSPDGLQLVFSSNLGGNANHDIYTDGSNFRKLPTILGGRVPRWSPK